VATVCRVTLRRLLAGLLTAALLVPAVLVTLARALDLPGGLWVRLTAFTPHAGLLYLAAAVVLLLTWLRGHGGIAVRVLTVLSFVGLGLHVYWASGPFVGSGAGDAEAAGHGRVHVMTANLRFGQADAAQLVGLVVAHDVDVLVVEEVTPQSVAGMRSAGLDQVLPHHAGRPSSRSTHGTMVFSRTPLRHVRRLSTTFNSYSLDVALRGPKGMLHLLAVHPHPPTGDIRGWHAEQTVVRRAAAGLSGPAVIAGDLNATMDHASLRELQGRGYDDAATQARSGWQPTWPSSGIVSPLGIDVPSLVAIDHVMARGLRATRTQAFPIEGTDHRALLAILAR
jgi:endonuclease/exonuclease/phosphatase (EEP) superfamily protein YafD